jgi:hypothetical protein
MNNVRTDIPIQFYEIPALPDTLSICDDEIKAIFVGKSYDVGLPIQAQLVKEIRLLRETIVQLVDEEHEYRIK